MYIYIYTNVVFLPHVGNSNSGNLPCELQQYYGFKCYVKGGHRIQKDSNGPLMWGCGSAEQDSSSRHVL